jgi:hypothetical protein
MLATIRKALLAAGFTLAGALGAALLDGNLTQGEAFAAVGTALVAGVATWRVPNKQD